MSYGKSISIDLHECPPTQFTRRNLKRFVLALCKYINVVPAKLVWWDYRWNPLAKRRAPQHLKGTSLVQFIETSTIVVHALEDLGVIYIDLFTCGDFETIAVIEFCEEWFSCKEVNHSVMMRQ